MKFIYGNDPGKFGYEASVAHAVDADGVTLSIALNIDDRGRLYELDVWKVDFEPLIALPEPDSLHQMRGTKR